MKAALLDCRPFAEYCAGHRVGACSLPAPELFARMHELPQRNRVLQLCGNPNDLQQASTYLHDRGYTVAEQIIWSPALRQQLAAVGELETGTHSVSFWQPTPLWRRFVEDIAPTQAIAAGRGLDIACGAGRDLIYLAQQGWQMTGIDRSADSLQRVTGLAQQANVAVKTLQRDLEPAEGADPLADFADNSFDLISVGRYLHRPLFPVMRRLLRPGGILLYQTFMLGCEQTAIGRPRNPAFLLRPAELKTEFSTADILLDTVETLADGRPVAAFVARL